MENERELEDEKENQEKPQLGFFRRIQIPKYLIKYPLINDEDA